MIDEIQRYTQQLGGAVGGLQRGDVQRVVDNLLDQCQGREVEVTVRPEVIGGYYSVEWRYLEFDREETCWKPVERCGEDS